MGYCSSCGAPCPHCIDRTDFSLLRLEEPVRSKVKKLLDETGVKTNERATRIIAAVAQYDKKIVIQAFRIWNNGGYVMEGKDERYFLGILRSTAVSKTQKLDPLPPLIEYDEEETGDE